MVHSLANRHGAWRHCGPHSGLPKLLHISLSFLHDKETNHFFGFLYFETNPYIPHGAYSIVQHWQAPNSKSREGLRANPMSRWVGQLWLSLSLSLLRVTQILQHGMDETLQILGQTKLAGSGPCSPKAFQQSGRRIFLGHEVPCAKCSTPSCHVSLSFSSDQRKGPNQHLPPV